MIDPTVVDMLNSLRRKHHYVDDCWYSCPKAEGGCCDDRRGGECDCGADEANATVDALLILLSQPKLVDPSF